MTVGQRAGLQHNGDVHAGWRFSVSAGIYILSGFPLFALVGRLYTFSDTGFTPTDVLVAKIADGASLLVISLALAMFALLHRLYPQDRFPRV